VNRAAAGNACLARWTHQATTVNLTPDWSILYQVAIFLVVYFGLRKLIFEPMQHVIAERNRRTVQAEHTAEHLIEAAHADRAKYDESVRERRATMAREAEAARHAAIEESNRQIGEARNAISRELASHRAAIAAQVEQARRALSEQADSIATEMLDRVTQGKRQ
jgi:F-type H+-transporting ATPase subunit b